MDNWLNVGIDGQGCWPREESTIKFGGYELLLKPATRKTEQSVHINLVKEKISSEDAMTLINRLLSVLSWCDGGSKGMDIIDGLGWSGNPIPVEIPIRNRMIGSSIAFSFYKEMDKNPKTRLALALYREGLVSDSVPVSFLSFFKIINIFYNDKTIRIKKQKPYNQLVEGLRSLIPHAKCDLAKQRLQELSKVVNDIPKYLYKRRCAIAHSFTDPAIDPDNVMESRDLSKDLWIVSSIADYLIENKLGVSRSILG
ncbi:MAG: hypothetical protein Q8N22_01725 [bacterium]|nr:hypothetical protein [bacterium]